MRNVLLTGASGFLGRKIVEAWNPLLGRLYICTGNKTITYDSELIVFDRDRLIDEIDLSNIDLIINCAFPMKKDGTDAFRGLDFIERMIIKAENSGVKYFINISSQSLYDPNRTYQAKEDDILCLRDAYTSGKYYVEKILSFVCKNMKYINVRLASLIGIGLDSRIINKFIISSIQDGHINLFGGNQIFEYMDVSDAASAILELCKRTDFIDEYNVCNLGVNKSYKLQELSNKVAEIGREMGISEIKIFVEENAVFSNNAIDSKKFYNNINWQPVFGIEDSIRKIYKDKIRDLNY